MTEEEFKNKEKKFHWSEACYSLVHMQANAEICLKLQCKILAKLEERDYEEVLNEQREAIKIETKNIFLSLPDA